MFTPARRLRSAPLVLAFLAAGCGQSRSVTLAELGAARTARQATYETARAEVVGRLARRVVARGDRTLDVLVLSGGGQHGAYGAGFLRGWRERAGEPMPRFDVVTGVSAGSLLSPFAFVGTPEALAEASELFRNPDAIQPRLDLVSSLLRRRGGLFDTARLKSKLGEVIDARLAARIGEGFAEGRQLFAGSTDLDLGQGRVWDVSRELDSTAAGRARYRTVILASTAIPGAFAPVEIDGRLHTDGGIRASMLAADLGSLRALAAELRRRGAGGPVNVRLWVVVNAWLQPPVRAVDGARLKAVTTRSNGLLLALGLQQALLRMWEVTEAVNADAGGLTMQMRYTAVPDAWSGEPGAMELFDETYMRKLEAFGYARALGEAPWASVPPGPFE